MEVKDCHGNILSQGDSVLVIKDLKVKGTSVTLKQGTKIKNIRLTEDEEEIACNTDKVKGLVPDAEARHGVQGHPPDRGRPRLDRVRTGP